MSVDKRPGADWDIRYMDIRDGEIEEMTVFGAVDIEAAIADARQNLEAGSVVLGADPDWYEILSVVRQTQ